MPIAYLVNSYPMGSQSFIRREIRAIEKGGEPVLRLALRGWREAPVDPDDREEQLRTHYLLRHGLGALVASVFRRMARSPRSLARAALAAVRMASLSERSLAHHMAYLAEASLLVDLLLRAGVTHLHAHFGTNSAEVAMLARLLGGPKYSFTVHGPEEFDKPLGLHLREKVAHAQFVVAVSSFGRSQLFRWLPYQEWPKVQVVHCGLEPEFHSDRTPVASAVPRFVSVGRLCEQKGQLLMLEAAQQLRRRDLRFELVLAGDGELRPELERQIALRDLTDCVRITGWLSSAQVREELLAARALVLPSFAEGLPVVIMEAMALERPVVTTAVAGIPELVRHGLEGWLVVAGDGLALADALAGALQADEETLRAMGQAARRRVLARHCADTEAGRLRQLFAAAT